MTKKQMKEAVMSLPAWKHWQQASVKQAYERLEEEMLIQYCGFVPPFFTEHE